MKIHPDLRHVDYMQYLMQREDIVKEVTATVRPFLQKYSVRVDYLLDEIEDEINEKSLD